MSEPTQIRRITQTITNYDLTLENTGSLKFLVFSDLHICQHVNLTRSCEILIDTISNLINSIHPSHIFILGDIVHVFVFHTPNYWTTFYEKLEQFNLPVYVIPGNHDRYIHSFVKLCYHGRNVHLKNVEILRVFVEGYQYPLIMGHDLKNDRKVHSQTLVRRWIQMLRSTYSNLIPEQSKMILGHLHDAYQFNEEKTYTLEPFSPSLGVFYYGVVTPNSNNDFDITFSRA